MGEWWNELTLSLQTHPLLHGAMTHLLTMAGVVLVAFAFLRILSERRQPGNTFAWLLSIAFIPYVGVPLYLLIGGRKLRHLAKSKAEVRPSPDPAHATAALPATPLMRALSQNGTIPVIGGNRVTFIETGEDAFTSLERGIMEARHSIHIMTFILVRDATGKRVVELLAARAREGIKVRLLLDGLGCFTTSRGFCDPIRRAGGEVARFMPMLPLQTRGSANLRNHRKMVVIDHRVAAVGGRNLALEYMGATPLASRWRDFGAIIEGPATGVLNELFLADWAFASGQSFATLKQELPVLEKVGESDLQIIASGPDVAGDPLYEGILALVQHATSSIWIVTPYFIPDEVLFRSLMIRARAGIDVRIVVPAKSNHPIADFARMGALRDLQSAGVQVLYYQHGMSHAKLMLVDSEYGLMGSANMDQRSLFVNFEVGLVTYTPLEARRMAAWMRYVFSQSTPMPIDSSPRRWWPSFAENCSRLVAPLL